MLALFFNIFLTIKAVHPQETTCKLRLNDGLLYFLRVVKLPDGIFLNDILSPVVPYFTIEVYGGSNSATTKTDACTEEYPTDTAQNVNFNPDSDVLGGGFSPDDGYTVGPTDKVRDLQQIGKFTPDGYIVDVLQQGFSPGNLNTKCYRRTVLYWYPVAMEDTRSDMWTDGLHINSTLISYDINEGECIGVLQNTNTTITVIDKLQGISCYHENEYFRPLEIELFPTKPCVYRRCEDGVLMAYKVTCNDAELRCPSANQTTEPDKCCKFCTTEDFCAQANNSQANNCASINAECINTDTDSFCRCLPGYHKVASGSCGDVDECYLGIATCDLTTTDCVNRPGTYICHKKNAVCNTDDCTCSAGFKDDVSKENCIDINECENANNDCDTFTTKCQNTPGSFSCDCKEPSEYFKKNRTHCGLFEIQYRLLDPSYIRCCGHMSEYGAFMVKVVSTPQLGRAEKIVVTGCLQPTLTPQSGVDTHTKPTHLIPSGLGREQSLSEYADFLSDSFKTNVTLSIEYSDSCSFNYTPEIMTTVPKKSVHLFTQIDFTNHMYRSSTEKQQQCKLIPNNKEWLAHFLSPRDTLKTFPSQSKLGCSRNNFLPITLSGVLLAGSLLIWGDTTGC